MISLELVGPDNLPQCAIGCLVDRKHPGHRAKVSWLQERFRDIRRNASKYRVLHLVYSNRR